jgi:signal transduction histidine kinase
MSGMDGKNGGAARARILIVDDDENVRESLHDELASPYEVETAAGGREALERLAQRVYDVVISDLRMPDVSGVEVLEKVRGLNPDAVRILLTGFLDEDAHAATLRDDAPFKIGKPWHGSVEVTLKRALEHRETTRRLGRQMAELGRIDEELARAEGVVGMARVLCERLAGADGVASAAVTVELGGARQDILRMGAIDPGLVGAWWLDEPLERDGGVRLEVQGQRAPTRAFAEALSERARRWFAEAPALRLAAAAGGDDRARQQLLTMARRADVGAMSASVMHELASLLQHFSMLAHDLEPLALAYAKDPEIIESIRGAREASERILGLFKQLRAFVSGKRPRREALKVREVVQSAVELCSGVCRPRVVRVSLGGVGDTAVDGDLALLTQVLVNLVRNAVDATARDGTIEVAVALEADGRLAVSVTDDGAGVPDEVRPRLFVPFATTKDPQAGSGLGLALSAMIVREHGGELVHEAPAAGGARFVVRLPRAAPKPA